MNVVWINGDARRKTRRILGDPYRSTRSQPRIGIDSVPNNGRCACRIDVVANEDTSTGGRCPGCVCITRGTGDRRDQTTGATRAPISSIEGSAQIAGRIQTRVSNKEVTIKCRRTAERLEVTAERTVGTEFRAECFEKRLTATPIRSPPYVPRSLVDRLRVGWNRIGNDWRIKFSRFLAKQDRSADFYPLGRVAILEITIIRLTGEGVEAQV